MPASNEPFKGFPVPKHSWTFPTVDGKVTFIVSGEVCMMYTFDADDKAPTPDEMYLGSALRLYGRVGCPIEMTREQALELAQRILESLSSEETAVPPSSG